MSNQLFLEFIVKWSWYHYNGILLH